MRLNKMNHKNNPCDRIILNGIQFYGFHGCNDFEKQLGQKFLVDVVVEVSLKNAGKSDDLGDTISYSHLFRTVKSVMEGPSRNLLESVVAEIADRIMNEFEVDSVKIRLLKLAPPIRMGVMDSAGVEIYRRRGMDRA